MNHPGQDAGGHAAEGSFDSGEIRSEIQALLASETFRRARRQADFLNWLCERVLAGNAAGITEPEIAQHAFGRDATSFDRRGDSIVRVEAHRLRKRLKQYYDSEGAASPLRIVLPPGRYIPSFEYTTTRDDESVAVGAEPAPAEGQPTPAQAIAARPGAASRRWLWAGLGGLGVVLLLFGALTLERGTTRARAVPPSPAVAASPSVAAGDPGIRILAGVNSGSYIDVDGNEWLPDRFFTGGTAVSADTPGSILRTRDRGLYRARREGTIRYDIPLDPGKWELYLHFAETLFGPGNTGGGGETTRLFDIVVNGETLIWVFDPIADAGGANVANIKVFSNLEPAPDGRLHVELRPRADQAFVNAIALVPMPQGRSRPFRMLAGSRPYWDASRNLWRSEQYFIGGQVITRSDVPTAGTSIPDLYKTERFGNFNYAIPVAPEGRYTVRLHFSERWFGPGKPGGGGAGSRLFNVNCNGVQLLRDFDIYKAAGANDTALERTFHGVVPNAQGKIHISFVPVKNYASVNAIEILPEAR